MEMCIFFLIQLCSYSLQQIPVYSYTRIGIPATVDSTVYTECPLTSIIFREKMFAFPFLGTY